MHLYLVQHGAAKSEAADPQRGLTDEGRRTVERVARLLEPLALSVARIEHSGKLRARQTADILAERLRPAGGTAQVSGLAPNDDLTPVLERLEKEAANILLVGHLPHLSRLASRLLGLPADRAAVQFQMGGVVRFDRNEAGQWAIRWAIVPELLAARE